MPLISVIVPTFNNAALLTETLDGIKRQTLSDVEVIVVDDGSTDDTAQVVKRYDPSIRYHYQTNRRQAAARNQGLALARSEYIAFCDHDDIWEEKHLEKLHGCFRSHPGTAMAFDNAEYFGAGVVPRPHLPAALANALSKSKVTINSLLWKYPVASMSVVMARKKALQGVNGLAEDVGVMDDYHLYLRLAAQSEVRYVDYIGCRKRVSGSNLSRLTNSKEMNLLYLEDIRRNHPEVIRQLGALSFRLRLSRKYFKLARHYVHERQAPAAAEMFRKAFSMNPLNLRYLLHCVKTRKFKKWPRTRS
jgi:glycosyltransferase involved in cell wall biosynthesis